MAVNIAKLRDQARTHEARDQWREAIAAYRQILQNMPGGDVDIGLWNRIGDLHLRQNEQDKAVEAYESAVGAYVDVGLYNNAIALCRKILRLVPGRANVYRRLGQISAAKGFFADARQNFLEYADRMRRAGQIDAAFEGLREFADLCPDDAEIRRVLADQLLSHGHRDEAIEQLRILLGMLLSRADEQAAEAVRQQIRAVDPAASTEPLERAQTVATGSDDFHAAFHADLDADDPRAGFSVGAEVADAATAVPPLEIEGLEVRQDFSRPAVEPEPESAVDDLPLMDLEGSEDAAPDLAFGEVDLEPTALAEPEEDEEEEEEEGEALPLMDFGDEGEAEPLPLLEAEELPEALEVESGFGMVDLPDADAEPPVPEPKPAPGDRVAQLQARLEAEPGDHAARDALVDLLHEQDRGAEALTLLEAAHRSLAEQARWRDAIVALAQLIRLRPGDDGPLLQKRVEYAFRSGERTAMVEAYMALARHFESQGKADKARAVYGRVLEIEPPNPEAREAIAALEASQPGTTPAAAAAQPAADYIDLGALILDEETDAEGSTRFVVEEHEPTGDEDRDFADMLAHFRQKVAENIEVEDSSSHYDLGLAFKEMGLLDEAIAEFQVALRGGWDPLATLEMLGACFADKGQYAVATRVLDRALRLPTTTDAELVGVLYQLGRCYELIGNPAQATEFYERVLSVDIRFRDTSARLEAMRRRTGAA